VVNVIEARRATDAAVPYREAPAKVAEPWIVTMQRGKGKPATLVIDGSELRALVHATLYPEGSEVAAYNKRTGLFVFGLGIGLAIVASVALMQVVDWVLAIPFGVFVGLVVGVRAAMTTRRLRGIG
jgi:hypothetical protein